ncbi:hypothetical protein TNCV_3426461 [Trichonephila clavipes]|nr:hypothetical protein TNCV_3426461 [Trichonephila clavipes]
MQQNYRNSGFVQRAMNWPGNSPDHNSIENMWHRLKSLVRMRRTSNKRELIEIFPILIVREFGTSETDSDSDTENLNAARQWWELNTDTPNPAPPEFIFQGDPGLNFCPDSDNILQFFLIFFDDGTLQTICNETNRYASQYLKKKMN